MGESLMKPFVLMITFIGVTIVLLGTMNHLQQSNMMAQNPETGADVLGGFNYTMLVPQDGTDITWLNATNSLGDVFDQITFKAKTATPHTIFYLSTESPGSRNAIWVYVVRNNTWNPWITSNIPSPLREQLDTRDMIVLAQKYAKHGWFDIKTGVGWRWHVIPYSVIDDRSDGNVSSVSFMFGGENYTGFTITPDTGSFQSELYTNNTYTFGLGQLWGFDTIGKVSMWKLVGQLLTCSLPNTNFYANLIMTICIWAVIAYVAIAMVSRFIPTISGL